MLTFRELNVLIELFCASFCVLTLLCVRLFSRAERWYRNSLVHMLAFVLTSSLSDAVAAVYRGQPGQVAWYGTHIGNALTFLATYATAGAFTAYLCARLEEEGTDLDWWSRAAWGVCAIGMVLTILGVFYTIDPDTNLYSRSQDFWVSQFIGMFIMVGDLVVLVARRRSVEGSTFVSMLLYILLPMLALAGQTYVGTLNLTQLALTITIAVLFVDLQAHVANTIAHQQAQLAQQDRELSDSRVQIMVSQIQPHFLYNTLDAIYYLCRKDPEMARAAISRFSDYLRMNLRSLSTDHPVPLDTELSHVENYLELERMSSDDTIDFELDVQTRSFMLPVLSLQPLVENAIKHGIGQREGGGTVRLSTRELDDCFEVVVTDDGVGFDVDATPGPGSPHVGIQNVRQRVASMCDGTLEVTSEPGVGTTATIRIPKER